MAQVGGTPGSSPSNQYNAPRLDKGFEHTLANGEKRLYPTRVDYAKWFIATGRISQTEELAQFANEVLYNWVSQGQTSCLFAGSLAQNFGRANWRGACIPSRGDGVTLRSDVDCLLDAISEESEAVTLAFPYVESPEQLVELINDLCSSGRWWWERITKNADGSEVDPDHVLIGLRYMISGGAHVSWVLGFAQFDFMPVTRRAPFTALMLRANSHKRVTTDREGPNGLMPVHLADMDSMLTSAAHHRLNEKTSERRKSILGTQLTWGAARGRVTFRMPVKFCATLTEHKREN